jgi:hypothetical protein
MGVELPFLSFLSTLLLTLILPAPIHYYSIPSASIIAWLFFGNIIHGINSILWFRNQALQAPVWCDICKFFVGGINNLSIPLQLPLCFLEPWSLFLVVFYALLADL